MYMALLEDSGAVLEDSGVVSEDPGVVLEALVSEALVLETLGEASVGTEPVFRADEKGASSAQVLGSSCAFSK